MSVATPRVLVAEDNPAISKVICFHLQQAGFQVSAALDGRQARETLEREAFDIVILDEQMPEMNGSDVCRHLRTLQHHQQTPVVFLTAKAFELDSDYVKKELGAIAVLSKPFSPSLLRNLCQETLTSKVKKTEASEC